MPSMIEQEGNPSGTFVVTVLPSGDATGAADATAINAAIAAASTAGGGVVKGSPGKAYYVGSTPYTLKSNVTLDMSGCTVTQAALANVPLVQNYSFANPAATASDGAVSSGSNVVTTALGAQAVVGQTLIVAGAGGNGNGPLVGKVASATSTTITINTLDGRACNATATVSAAAVTLYNRDQNLRVRGGLWVGGANNGTNANLHRILFRHCDFLDIDIDGASSPSGVNSGKYLVALGGCTQFRVSAPNLNSGSDGVHINGPAFQGHVAWVTGTTVDDFVAFTCSEYPNHNDTTGDIVAVTVGFAHGTTGGANLRLLAGAGWLLDEVKVTGALSGNPTTGLAVIGDDVAQAATTGGTYGTIDCGPCYGVPPSGAPALVLYSPAADRIKANLRYLPTTGSPTAVSVRGTSTVTIDELELSGDMGGTCNPAVLANAASVTINTIRLNDVRFEPTGAFPLVAVSAGVVGKVTAVELKASLGGNALVVQTNNAVTVGDVSFIGGRIVVPSPPNGYLVFCNGTSTVSRVNLSGGGRSQGLNAIYRNVSGVGACNVVIGNWVLDICNRAVDFFNTAGTSTVTWAGATVISMTSAAVFTSGATTAIFGTAPLVTAGTFTLLQRNASESVRVHGPTLPVDVATLTPSNGDMATNINASNLYGGNPCTVVYDGTSWRATRGYLKSGTATLVAGTVTVSDTNITANSVIRLATRTVGGTQGAVYVSALTASTSFAITSTSATDTSVIEYEVVRY